MGPVTEQHNTIQTGHIITQRYTQWDITHTRTHTHTHTHVSTSVCLKSKQVYCTHGKSQNNAERMETELISLK